ncbi:hypothetical protein V1478_002191 [Vespula squamosa]|uniref:Uncharacterized protein n=1 Tax=Vespula squamosa TaxID=30214 RepID=A0ABD2BWA0_VESSQ
MDHEVSEFNVVFYNEFVKMTDKANSQHYLEMHHFINITPIKWIEKLNVETKEETSRSINLKN